MAQEFLSGGELAYQGLGSTAERGRHKHPRMSLLSTPSRSATYPDVEGWQRELTGLFPDTRVTAYEPFPGGRMEFHTLAGTWLIDVAGGRQDVFREALEWRDFVSIICHVEGFAGFEHMGRTCDLTPGSIVLLNGAQPSALHLAGAHRQRLLLVPRAVMPLAETAFARTLNPDDPVDALIAHHLCQFADHAPQYDAVTQRAMLAALTALFSAATVARTTPEVTRFCVRTQRALAMIERTYPDPQLAAEHVAQAQGVSRRYLDALLAQHGTTLSTLIWERRLEGAAQLLKTHPERTILQIALDCGFQDASHFSRRFRGRFGVTPSQWRSAASPTGDPR
ncbi:MAG: helix-turn-helix domain-containing protein [Myxococcota bacterium]